MIRVIYLQIIFFFLIEAPTSSQNINWAKCYGGSYFDISYNLIRTSDGGALCTGFTSSNDGDIIGWHGFYDLLLILIDSVGSIQWTKCLGGSDSEIGYCSVEVLDGYVIGGASGSTNGDATFNNGSADFWVVKVDFNGMLVWQHSYGGILSDGIFSVAKSNDDGFILSGVEYSGNSGDITNHHGIQGSADVWIVKIDSSGNMLWQTCFGGTSGELYGRCQTDDEGNIYVVCSSASSDGDNTCHQGFPFHGSTWLIKLNSLGDILWNKCYGGTLYDLIQSISIKNDKILMSGLSTSDDYDLSSNFGHSDAWLLVTDTAGNISFSRSYGGSQSDEFTDAKFTSEGNIVACGITVSNDSDVTSNHPGSECWIVSFDSLGNIVWENTYGGSLNDRASSILDFDNGKILFAGSTASPNDGDVTGFHDLPNHRYDVWIVSLNAPVSIPETISSLQAVVYPNPFTSNITITTNKSQSIQIKIFDVLGNQLFEKQCPGKQSILNLEFLQDGIYIVSILSNGGKQLYKLIKVSDLKQ